MFDEPISTIHNSLNKLLSKPKEYLADICFCFPSSEIWAHRAIILARAPKIFVESYLPELLYESHSPLKLDISQIICQELFQHLLRFWYTASFVSLESTDATIAGDTVNQLEGLSVQLGVPLLPLHSDSVPDSVQLIDDLKCMLHENIATDVTIHIIPSSDDKKKPDTVMILSTCPDNNTQQVNIPTPSFKAHKFILAAQSSYFYSLFCTQFQEASSSVVHLTDDLFNVAIVDTLLTFFYTDRIIVSSLPKDKTKSRSHHDLQQSKHDLRVMQKTFYAADYLGHSETLGKALLYKMQQLCHGFKCFCSRCAVILPSMLAWSDKHVELLPELRRTLILLYCDPVQSLAPFWSQRPFAFLISSLVSSSSNLGKNVLQTVLKQEPLIDPQIKFKSVIHEIESLTFSNVTKHNAIHVLSSLHMCLSRIRSADPTPTWSQPALNLINPILHYTVSMVSQFFDFYCVEYPILLSCVDGIGAGFSVDFLDFLLTHVLTEGIQETNAGVIYQGIVRDLVGRQEVVKNMAIDDVLLVARARCAAYINQRWTKVKNQGGFMKLEKNTLRQLAEDIGVPYRAICKPSDTDFSHIFSFKPRKSKKSFNYSRRFSVDPIIEVVRPKSRPRALSAESPFVVESIRETEAKRLSTSSSLLEQQRPMLRTSASFTSLTDQLLPVEPLAVTPRLEEKPSRLKFELPTRPLRSNSPIKSSSSNAYLTPKKTKRGQNGKLRKPRWSMGGSDVSDEEDVDSVPLIGDKVELLRRPLPTLGTIKYIGPVQFAEGPYIGVELESRLGKSDGSIDGIRYFYTDPQRALFVKPDDFKILYHQR
ncbi:hypothetical protein G6F37_010891 [Rhizopus arrhizus]|nr:hypothetical protein G6F38_004500 [Rhizopus arrhizus]KAG1151943.1 hypothetical protein G6F37_010891 [Rhizopus arrhizus]